MRRRIAALLGAVLVASAFAVVAPAPASATDVCAGQGVATTGPLFYPVTPVQVNDPRTVGFAFGIGATGQCVSSDGTLLKQLTASGTLTGYCGHSSGQGTANDGANFAWISVGSLLIVTGHLVGIVNAIPNPLTNQSCLTGATQFLVTGAALLLHCATLTSSLMTPDVPTVDVPIVEDMNYHTSVCVPRAL